jgi:hypothetical protein
LADDDVPIDDPAHNQIVAECYYVFMQLLTNKNQSEFAIFEGIKKEIEMAPDDAGFFRAMLVGMAEASDGVSESEQIEINRILEAINI